MPAPLRLLVPLALLAAFVVSASPGSSEPPSAAAERFFEDGTLEPFAEALAAFEAARAEGRGTSAAREGLVASLEALAREHEGTALLAAPEDLARAALLARAAARPRLRGGSVETEAWRTGTFPDGLEIAWRAPRELEAGARYPLVLAIGDEGTTPAEHLRASWSARAVRDGALVVCPAMPAEQAEWSRVSVAGRPGGLCHVLTALRFAAERLPVDFDRVIVAGHGKGVPAALAAADHAPQRFAGVVGRAGDAAPLATLGPGNLAHVPIWLGGGGANARALAEAARAAGGPEIEVVPAGSEEDAWTWMAERVRARAPETATVVVGQPFPTRCYWLRVAPSASDARVSATIERAENLVRVTARGVTHVTLYLDDALVDLDRPVTVVAGEVRVTELVPRRLSTVLELLADGTSDPGRVYTAELVVDVRAGVERAAESGVAVADPEYAERHAAAAGDVGALHALHAWCVETGRPALARAVLKEIVRVAPEGDEAHAALGHVRAGGRWFVDVAAAERWRASQEPELARARGFVEHNGVWMHPDARALVGKGLERDPETGAWLGARERARLAEGWARQDEAWIPPADAHRVDRGEWLVEGEWCDLATANRRHARVDSMWRIPTPEVRLWATVDRAVALRALEPMRRALGDLRKVFGTEPLLPLEVCVLRDEEQYDRFAFGAPDGRRAPAHRGRRHVVHSAVFAESWFDRVDGEPVHRGMGVCYWDPRIPHGDLYGVHSARLAFALSLVDALDPSPKAVRRALSRGAGEDFFEEYEAEKRLPAWLRLGAAVYAERFFEDDSVAEGGDRWWARKWSLENLAGRGGPRPLADVLACRVDPDDREDALKLYIEAGCVVAFTVDGGCAPVVAAHAELKDALAAGRLRPSHGKALEEALLAHEAELRAFATP